MLWNGGIGQLQSEGVLSTKPSDVKVTCSLPFIGKYYLMRYIDSICWNLFSILEVERGEGGKLELNNILGSVTPGVKALKDIRRAPVMDKHLKLTFIIGICCLSKFKTSQNMFLVNHDFYWGSRRILLCPSYSTFHLLICWHINGSIIKTIVSLPVTHTQLWLIWLHNSAREKEHVGQAVFTVLAGGL